MIICNWFDWPPFCCLAMCSCVHYKKTANHIIIIIHKLCWLGNKQVVYLARSKCTPLAKFVLHASVVCSLVAFLASQWYHTFQLFSNLLFLGLFSQQSCIFEWDINSFFKAGLYGTCLSNWIVLISYIGTCTTIDSQKMIISLSKSLMIWIYLSVSYFLSQKQASKSDTVIT